MLERKILKTYLLLTKPGIVLGNALSVIGGFFLASKGNFHLELFLSTLFGISFIIASACVFNNYIDRGIDEKMARTRTRALVTGLVSGPSALIFAFILVIVGTLLLIFFTNFLTVFISLFGFFMYVIIYGFFKRRSTYGTLIGSLSGAVPPVVGYCAVSSSFDAGAIILFLILVFWQMPHFFAVAIYRLKDYSSAGIPVLPVRKGILNTKINMLFYIFLFTASIILLWVFGYTGYTYLFLMIILSLIWVILCIRGFKTSNDIRWAREMFRYSLIVLTIFCILISVNSMLY